VPSPFGKRRPILPNGRLDALRQLLLFAGAYYLYRVVRGVVDGQVAAAFSHARGVIDLERGLHLFFEPGLQSWVEERGSFLIHFADIMYVNAHFLLTLAFLVWLYFKRNENFYFVRNMFIVAMGLALIGYVVFPTAPPRFMQEWGFQDAVGDWVGQSASQTASLLYNPYAAMPSMHVAFALMVGVTGARLVKWRPLKIAWSLYPLLITWVVIVTANHFWLDAAMGGVVAALSAYTSAALAKARPDAWAFAGATA
jgi:membrane-associated phospholipid phosphatase